MCVWLGLVSEKIKNSFVDWKEKCKDIKWFNLLAGSYYKKKIIYKKKQTLIFKKKKNLMWREERGIWINSHPSPSFSPISGWEFTHMGKLTRQEFFVYTDPRILNKHTRIRHLPPLSTLINRDKIGKFPKCWVEVFCFLSLYSPHPIK